MEFQKISSPSLRDLFVEQLEHLILSGKLKIGERRRRSRNQGEYEGRYHGDKKEC